MNRREALFFLGLLSTAGACAPGAAAPAKPAGVPPLVLEPLVDLVPAAGLVWLIEMHAAELLGSPVIAPAVALVLPAPRLDAFAERHGGVDLRRVERLALAGYPGTLLALASGPVDAGRIEGAFAARAVKVEGHALDGGITRFWGSVGAEREQVALFDGSAVGLERGHFGPLRAATYFARGKLKRALPALSAEPLVHAKALVGEAPLRAFAPGPFENDWGRGLGGLLRATAAVAASARPLEAPAREAGGTPVSAIEVGVVLMGGWGADASRAAGTLGAAFQLLANDPVGRLTGLDRPIQEPRVSGDAQALRLQVVLDASLLARGLQAATDAGITEIMAY